MEWNTSSVLVINEMEKENENEQKSKKIRNIAKTLPEQKTNKRRREKKTHF